MCKGVVVVATVFLTFVLVNAKPAPQLENNDSEPLKPRDNLHYVYAFWLGRPFYESDDDSGGNVYSNLLANRRTSTMSYAQVG
ncbi:hypothetical protein WN55_03507 [Dufourea novaeangliae]|uniref:Uncharacterized protein n=1 Tax=Dufourea novaeangliae TaxID=178035 RepID=A0A154PJI6_DUFNO|nr:hypothetical protein WN55_03507 [Dufourea novaeangliae]